jgi:hypothetical protein
MGIFDNMWALDVLGGWLGEYKKYVMYVDG